VTIVAISRDLINFQIESQNFQIRSQNESQCFKSNFSISNWITKMVQIAI